MIYFISNLESISAAAQLSNPRHPEIIFYHIPNIFSRKLNGKRLVNSEGFLAEVFHPWVRWEGPGSGFENSSGAGGVWKSRIGLPWDFGSCSKIWIFSNPIFLRVFQKLEPAFFKTSFFCGFLKNGTRPFFQKSQISKISSSSHSKNARIKLNGFQWVFGGWGDTPFIFFMGWIGQKSKNGPSRAVYPPGWGVI